MKLPNLIPRSIRLRGLIAAAVLCTTLTTSRAARGDDAAIDFVRDVQPIFQARCIGCHGPAKQQSGYRLDAKTVAFAGGELGQIAIVAGKPAESPLLDYITGNGDLRMPPEGPLCSAEEIATIRKWIEQGAKWPDSASIALTDNRLHWAFQPLQKVELPSAAADVSARNSIDAFIRAKLAANGLTLSVEADRRVLCRRAYFDITGLPPTPEALDSFISDPDPQAYEKLVDRLLASPQFGERWARHWLDVVRFAESNGFETNRARPNAWPYRDYVIDAFNNDKPYDKFVREQLAGDFLGADAGTGFIVAGPWDEVKSPDPTLTAQQRADELHDMVSATSSTFLGLTVGCARCHNHKFDPITQIDYYALKACFAGVQHGERAMQTNDEPERIARSVAGQARLREVDASLARLQPLAGAGRIIVIDDDSPRTRELLPANPTAINPPGVEQGSADDPGNRDRLPNIGRSYKWWQGPKDADLFAWSPGQTGRYRIWLSWGTGWDTHTFEASYWLDADGDPATRGDQTHLLTVDQRFFADETGQPFVNKPLWGGLKFVGEHEVTERSSILLRCDGSGRPVTADVVVLEEVTAENSVGGNAAPLPKLRQPVVSGLNIDRFPPTPARLVRFRVLATNNLEPCLDELEVFNSSGQNVALAASGAKATASGSFTGADIHKLEHVNDGRYGNSWSWISNEVGQGWVQIEFPQIEQVDRVAWSRDRTDPPQYQDRTATQYEIETSLDGISWQTVATSQSRLPYGWLKNRQVTFRNGIAAGDQQLLDTLTEERAALQRTIAEASARPMIYAGRFTSPEPTPRLHRGDATQPKEAIAPAGLSQLGVSFELPLEASDAERRTALANWMVEGNQALAARVIVNRLWQHHFGVGIVDTPSDFGVNGGRPTHPELLDWLANELIAPTDPAAQAWSLKHIHRLMLLSAAFRQSSTAHEAGLSKDAQSRLLWRYPPRRLEAEALRDSILSVSGKLNSTASGPGFDLFEPNGNYVKVYTSKQTFGAETFRRMIYQNKPRMQLDDTFGVFDCPDAGQIAPKRNVSTTPLQALNMFNSPFMLQQAEFFAQRLQTEAGDDRSTQVQRAFRLALGRSAADDETLAAVALIQQHGLPIFCRALLNANEFVTVE